MSQITVTTREELKTAYEKHYDTIIVKGELAKVLYQTKKISRMSRVAIASLAISITIAAVGAALAPVTAGGSMVLSVAAAAPVATATGFSVEAIILIAFCGVAMIIGLFRDYNIEFQANPPVLRMEKK